MISQAKKMSTLEQKQARIAALEEYMKRCHKAPSAREQIEVARFSVDRFRFSNSLLAICASARSAGVPLAADSVLCEFSQKRIEFLKKFARERDALHSVEYT